MVKNVVKLLFQAIAFLMTHLPTNASLTIFSSSRQHFSFLSFLKINIFRNNQKCVEKLVLARRFVTLRRFLANFPLGFGRVSCPDPPKSTYIGYFAIIGI